MTDSFLSSKEIAIVAYGETKIVRKAAQTESEMAAAVLRQTLHQTGIDRNAIDGLATTFGPGERF